MTSFDTLDEKVKKLPNNAGVYKYLNGENELIYVGKAKNIKKRVTSYFTKSSNHNRKTQKLVREIRDLEYIVVNTEFDALLLENSLIKENQPKYNILLKDDKSFPHIIITNESFPRVYSTRRIIKNKGEYFGPYANVKMMNGILELIKKLNKIRTCNLDLSDSNIKETKFKVCLEYHIGNCLGPCEGLQSKSSYNEDIEQVKHILKGNLKAVKDHYLTQMASHASNLEYEKAQIFKNYIDQLDKFQSKSIIVNLNIPDADVFTILSEEKKAYINYLKIVNGTITTSETLEISKKLDESNEEILQLVIYNLREKYKSSNKLILTNIEIEIWDDTLEIKKPAIGDKKKLIDLSLKNIIYYKKDRKETTELKLTREERVLKQLQSDLKLTELPKRIECFDNSNIQGTNPVASMVCFTNGKPNKKEYRHYKIKTVTGPDDFASMSEIVLRRYKRVIEEDLEKPNLIIIDGGKGQLSAAVSSLKEVGLYGKVPIIGIAKRLEEIYYPEDNYPLYINKKSESLLLIQYLRNEAHRFAITFHRDLRSKNSITSELDTIKGIGEKTKYKLLQKFGTISGIRSAKFETLVEIAGNKKAVSITEQLKQKKEL
jgi:excinuclease ABC subunit C